jgi:deferrochelatase/peroxidase EfeB
LIASAAAFRAARSPWNSTMSRGTVPRYRPEPYYGTHATLHVADAQTGREFLRRRMPYVDSAAEWWQFGEAWTSIAISYTGLVALGMPQDSLQSFPEAFRVGMAARADQLRDYGPNDPKNWEKPFGTGEIHVTVSIFSETEDKWRRAMETARQPYWGFTGVNLLLMQDFGVTQTRPDHGPR